MSLVEAKSRGTGVGGSASLVGSEVPVPGQSVSELGVCGRPGRVSQGTDHREALGLSPLVVRRRWLLVVKTEETARIVSTPVGASPTLLTRLHG